MELNHILAIANILTTFIPAMMAIFIAYKGLLLATAGKAEKSALKKSTANDTDNEIQKIEKRLKILSVLVSVFLVFNIASLSITAFSTLPATKSDVVKICWALVSTYGGTLLLIRAYAVLKK